MKNIQLTYVLGAGDGKVALSKEFMTRVEKREKKKKKETSSWCGVTETTKEISRLSDEVRLSPGYLPANVSNR